VGASSFNLYFKTFTYMKKNQGGLCGIGPARELAQRALAFQHRGRVVVGSLLLLLFAPSLPGRLHLLQPA